MFLHVFHDFLGVGIIPTYRKTCPEFKKLHRFNKNDITYVDKVQSFQSRMYDMKSNYPDKIQKVAIMYGVIEK